jgi:hypothetical protein
MSKKRTAINLEDELSSADESACKQKRIKIDKSEKEHEDDSETDDDLSEVSGQEGQPCRNSRYTFTGLSQKF